MAPSLRNVLRVALCALAAAISIGAAARATDYTSFVYVDNQSDTAVYVTVEHRSSPTEVHPMTAWCAPPHSDAYREVHGATNIVSFRVLEYASCKDRVLLRVERSFPWQGESVTRWRYLLVGSDGKYSIDGPLGVR